MLVITALIWPVTIVRFYMGWMQMVMIDLPLIIAAFSLTAFYIVAQKELNPKEWKRSILLMPALMAAGVGLTVVNASCTGGGVRNSDQLREDGEVRHRRAQGEASEC